MRAKKILREHYLVAIDLGIALLHKLTLQAEEVQHIIATSEKENNYNMK